MLNLKLVRSDLRRQRGRVVATVLTIALATMLLLGSRILAASTDQALSDAVGVPLSTSDVLLRSTVAAGGTQSSDSVAGTAGGSLDPTALTKIAEIPGVTELATSTRTRAAAQVGDVTRGIALESLPNLPGFAWQRLAAGRAPAAGAEIALTGATLDALRIGVGDQVALGHPGVGRALFRVVGEIDVRGAVEYAGAYGVVPEAVARSLAGVDAPNVAMIRTGPGTDTDAVIDAINSTAPGGFAQPTSDLRNAGADSERSRAAGIGTAISGFALLALITAALVTGTTTAVSLGSRRRAMALLRSLGATRGQVARLVLLEVGLLGGVGIVIGLALGLAAGWVALPLAGALPGLPAVPLSAYTVRPGDVVLTVVVTAVLAAVSALVPAWIASRVAPAEALSQQTHAVAGRRLLGIGATSVVALLVGAALVGTAGSVVQLVVGCVLLLVGAMAATIPLLAGIAALVTRHSISVERRLAAAEITRDPRRAGAEGVALVLGAALVACTWVGLSSICATVSQRLSATPLADLTIGAPTGSGVIAPDVIEAVEDVPGVAHAVQVPFGTDVRITGKDGDRRVAIAIGTAALSADDLDRALPDGSPVETVADDAVYLPTSATPPYPEGALVTLEGADATVKDVSVVYVDDLDVPSLVSPALMERISPETEVRMLWTTLATGADRGAAIDAITGEAVLGGQLPVSGPAVVDQQVATALSAARTTATALLAVALVVAVIGAGTTSALSVREQWREHAIVRALGLERRSLRRVVAWRLAALSTTAGVLGAVVGAGIGAGVARFAAGALGVDPAMRWPVLPIVVLVVVIAALVHLATTGPAERAALVRPARALTEG